MRSNIPLLREVFLLEGPRLKYGKRFGTPMRPSQKPDTSKPKSIRLPYRSGKSGISREFLERLQEMGQFTTDDANDLYEEMGGSLSTTGFEGRTVDGGRRTKAMYLVKRFADEVMSDVWEISDETEIKPPFFS